MTTAEFKRCFRLASNRDVSLAHVDDSILHGIALHGAVPVMATADQVARLMRDYQYLNGQWDMEAINSLRDPFQRKVVLVGD